MIRNTGRPHRALHKLAEAHIVLPFVLTSASAALLSSGDERVFLGASFLGAGAAVYILAGILFSWIQVRISWLLACALLLGYGLGSFNSGVRLAVGGVSLSDYFARPQGDLSTALAFVYLVIAVLLLAGYFLERPIATTLESFGITASDSLLALAGGSLVAAAFATGGVGFMGVQTTLDHRVSPLGVLGGLASLALPAFTLAVQAKCHPRVRIVLWLCIAAEVLALVPQGRRITICGLLLLAFVYLRLDRNSRPIRMATVTLFVCSIGFLYAANLVFYAMRHSVNESGDRSETVLNMATTAFTFLTDGRDGQFDQQVAENSRDRTFILTYFSDLLAASWSHAPLYGRDALFCLETSIPSGLFADKAWVRDIGMEENLANPQFGLFPEDDPNSIMTTGVSDFGVWGVFLYPMALTCIMASAYSVLGTKLPGPIRLLALLLLLNLMVQSEVPGTQYIGFLRDLPLLLFVLWPAYAIPRLVRHRRRPASSVCVTLRQLTLQPGEKP